MKRMFLLAAILSSATFLVSCGGGGGGEESTTVATEDLQVRVDPTNGESLFTALEGESFVYEGGVPTFETATDTQVDIVGPGANQQNLGFRIASGGDTATGALEFGSCIFRILGSTYRTKLTVGTSIKVRDCDIIVNTTGKLADGEARRVPVTVVLNGKRATRFVNLRIRRDGTILINSVIFGSVKVRTVTGTGGF
ncbi:MAG: hypothetical protein K0Q43_1221 [Ramlibacter sp.]|jgi:hypothetical protein|nr:hypothetical protein [Ramlibacter sp.]MDF2462986.1 hypothetical protein [Ramlibacter sp.]